MHPDGSAKRLSISKFHNASAPPQPLGRGGAKRDHEMTQSHEDLGAAERMRDLTGYSQIFAREPQRSDDFAFGNISPLQTG